MANIAGTISWILDLDDKKFKSGLDASKGAASSFASHIGGVFKTIGKAALVMGTAAAGAFAGFVGLSIKAAADSETGLAQLDARLKSTAGAAGVTRQAAIDLSKEIEHHSTISDEAALAVENMGLTFTSIGKKIFPDFSKAVVDVGYALNNGLRPSQEQLIDITKQMGKAFQDPDQAIGALHRMGVNTDELAKKLKTLHTTEEKQVAILKELQKEFGGSAAAARDTFAGSIDVLKESVDDLEETFGTAIIKGVTPFIQTLAKWASSKEGEKFIEMLMDKFKKFTDIVGNLIKSVWPYVVEGFKIAYDTAKSLWEAVSLLITGDFKGGIFGLKEDDPWIVALLNARDTILKLVDEGKKFAVWAVDTGIKIYNFLKPAIMQLLTTLKPLWDALVRLWPILQPLALLIGGALVVAVYLLIKGLTFTIQWVTFVINKFVDFITWVGNLATSISNFITYVLTNWNKFWTEDIPNAIGTAVGFIAAKIIQVVDFFLTLPQRIFNAIWDNRQTIIDVGGKIITGLVDAFEGAVGNLIDWFKKLPGRLIKSFKDSFKAAGNFLGSATKEFSKQLGIDTQAMGTNFAPGGPTLVGERGPELVNLPRGSQVIPNNKIGGGTYNIYLEGIMARSRSDLRQIGEDIISAIDESRRAKGKDAILG